MTPETKQNVKIVGLAFGGVIAALVVACGLYLGVVVWADLTFLHRARLANEQAVQQQQQRAASRPAPAPAPAPAPQQ